MRTEVYSYELLEYSSGREIVTFHFGQSGRVPENPAAAILAPDAHLHLGAASNVDQNLQGLHIPTGRVSIEDIVLLTIELGLPDGLRPRDDWEQVITDSRELFRKFQTSNR